MRVLLIVERDGQQKLVGKCIMANGKLIVYRQRHNIYWLRELNSPHGVDADVLAWMEKMRVQEYHFFASHEGDIGRLFMATTEDLLKYGIWVPDNERDKLHLPLQLWRQQSGRPYDVPFIHDYAVVPPVQLLVKNGSAQNPKVWDFEPVDFDSVDMQHASPDELQAHLDAWKRQYGKVVHCARQSA